MPGNEAGSYEDIKVGNKIYGRVVRTHMGIKSIYVSSGNYIDLHTATETILNLINEESRLPIPVRLADVESIRMRRSERYHKKQ